MAIIHIRSVIELEVDTDKYVAAGIEADAFADGEIDPTDFQAIAEIICPNEEEEIIPRWARGSLTLLDEFVHVVGVTEVLPT